MHGHNRPQDDLPYEQRMKHIIQGYRRLLEQNEKLADYARSIERKIGFLEKEITTKAAKNVEISNKFVEKNRECKRLKAHIKWIEEQIEKNQG